MALDPVWKLELAVDHEWQDDSKDVGSNGIPDTWLLLKSDGVGALEDWPGSYSWGEELDLFHITLPLKSGDADVDCEHVELIDDCWRVCLCSGGVGAKDRSEISKLSLKLFVRAGLSEMDIEDMTVVDQE